MTKADLVDTVAKAVQINKRTAGEAVDATFDGIIKAIKKGNRFQVPGFGTFTVRARLTNTSERAGDEVPQLYARPRVASTVAGKQLIAYRRVHLGAHESRLVEFTLPTRTLATLDAQDRWVIEPGTVEITLGTSARGGLAGTFELYDAPRAAARVAVDR